MPFKSRDQWRWAFAHHMKWARKWAHETPGGFKSLPKDKVNSSKGGRRIIGRRRKG